jgi:hypothetical protein
MMNQVNKLLISSILIFILFAFLPLIGDLVLTASTEPGTETVTILVPWETREATLTQKQYDALLDVYNGDAISLMLDRDGDEYPLVEDYELVDPDYEFRTDAGYYELAEVVQTDEWIFRFIDDPQDGLEIFEFTDVQDIPYLDTIIEQLQEDSLYTIILSITVETSTAKLNNLIPIVAVLITTSAILIYFKFR